MGAVTHPAARMLHCTRSSPRDGKAVLTMMVNVQWADIFAILPWIVLVAAIVAFVLLAIARRR